MILAIDPGNIESAYVLYDEKKRKPVAFGKIPNDEMFFVMCDSTSVADKMVIEMIACYGMPVGASVFDTCVWIGRFVQAWGGRSEFMYRRTVKMHLCNSTKAKDSNVRQAILDKFPPSGGGKTPQIGVRAKPGPLYGMAGSDIWAAMGVALTYCNQ